MVLIKNKAKDLDVALSADMEGFCPQLCLQWADSSRDHNIQKS